MLPFIIFCDIDKTLIGQAHAASDRFWLRKAIAEMGGKQPAPLEPAQEMRPLLRPGVGEGLRRIVAALAPCAELFVCSAGTRPLVAELKVPGVERACGVRFNRPLFCASTDPTENCRSSAFGHLKLVRVCFDRAVVRLRRKYPALAQPGAADRVFNTRFFMVDDTPGVALDAASNRRLLTCPPYEFKPWADPFEGVPLSVQSRSRVAEYVRARALSPAPPGQAAAAAPEDAYWPQLAAEVERRAGKAGGGANAAFSGAALTSINQGFSIRAGH